jgi:hypothetical protein
MFSARLAQSAEEMHAAVANIIARHTATFNHPIA